MIVCVCHRVSDHDIARVAQQGCASFDELQLALAVATSCGKCHECAHETFRRHAAPSGVPGTAATQGTAAATPHGARRHVTLHLQREVAQFTGT